MSFTKKDRKIQSEFGKTFPAITPDSLAQVIAAALRAEFGATPSAVKTVARLTRSNERAVRNWFDGKNGPSSDNLVVLMRHSNIVLKAVLELADRPDLVLAVGILGLREQLVDVVAAIDKARE
ncbi:MAG: hypothetical protein AB7E05_07170 [Sphingobium sp.]|jgi:hypothetical protein